MFQPENRPPESSQDDHCLVFQRGAMITDMRAPQPCLIPRRLTRLMGWELQNEQFMGYWDGVACFASELDEQTVPDSLQFTSGNLYQLLGRVSDDMFALAGRSSQLLTWARENRFCGVCGTPMEFNDGERAMHCPNCSHEVYPRISPCIIVLITRGDEVLLGRSRNFPQDMYSTLAGFIEAGENAEQTVHREVREEVGVRVQNVKYFASQSWPFPSQLMLGYFAEYKSGDIVLDDDEIVDAQWFHRDALPRTPPASAVSGQLIQAWLQGRS